MAGYKDDPVADQLVGHRRRLLGVAEVVAHADLDALAEDAALGVDVVDREPGGAQVLLAKPALRAGHRTGDADPDFGPGGCRCGAVDGSRNHPDNEQRAADHGPHPPPMGATLRLPVTGRNADHSASGR
jgi:hypothetical protein